MKTKITYTEKAQPFILEALGLEKDSNGLIIYSDSKKPILSKNGETIKDTELAGMTKDEFFKK